MILTPSQVAKLLEIIDVYTLRMVVRNVSDVYLTPSEKLLLQSYGISTLNINSSIEMAFKYGILAESLGKTAENMTFKQIQKIFQSGRFIEMSAKEKIALEAAESFAYNEMKGLGNRMKQDMNRMRIEVDQKLASKYAQTIKEETLRALDNKQSAQQLASALGHRSGDWARDFNRMSDYLINYATEHGRAGEIERHYGVGAEVYFIVRPDACQHCKRLLLDSDQSPKTFKLSEIRANGTNIGRKVTQWRPVIGSQHPNCMLPTTNVMTDRGWVALMDIKKDDQVLSNNYESNKAEWVNIEEIVDYEFDGEMHKYEGQTFSHTVTYNHRLPIQRRGRDGDKRYWKETELIPSNEVLDSYRVVRTAFGWDGEELSEVRVGSYSVDHHLFAEFMGWYLSEGCAIKRDGKESYVVSIAQSKEVNLDKYNEIARVMSDVFERTYLTHNSVCATVDKYTYDYLKQFGSTKVKFVPQEIKDASQDVIKTFLDAFEKGDGSRRVRDFDGHVCKPEVVYATSSIGLRDDLCELIMKLGLRPSIRVVEPREVVIRGEKHQCGVVYIISVGYSQYTQMKSVTKEVYHYQGRVMCLRLDKNFNFFTLEDGKITNTGNCNCTIHSKAPWEEWDKNTNSMQVKLTPRAQEIKERRQKRGIKRMEMRD